jgi:hypothetical protein
MIQGMVISSESLWTQAFDRGQKLTCVHKLWLSAGVGVVGVAINGHKGINAFGEVDNDFIVVQDGVDGFVCTWHAYNDLGVPIEHRFAVRVEVGHVVQLD